LLEFLVWGETEMLDTAATNEPIVDEKRAVVE
jgi:hypothetical protein